MSHDRANGGQASDAPLLSVRGISKSYPGVQALRDVSLELRACEVLALVGENGAGKSTLIKVLGGSHQPDHGTIHLDGHVARITSPLDAQRARIAVIYQEFNLVPALSAAENIFLGRETTRFGLVRRGELRRRARELFARIGVPVDPDAPCRSLSVAQQQAVEIAKALSADARILIMDEPTAALSASEVDRLLATLRGLQAQGLGILYISHRLEEVFRIAGRVTVLRDGAHVATRDIGQVDRDALIELMVGRRLSHEPSGSRSGLGEPLLVVRGLSRGSSVRDVSLTVRRGEVLGLTGLVGAGRTETARLIFGADRPDEGTVELAGKKLRLKSPRDAIRAGICLLTEDRKQQGLMLNLTARENFSISNLSRWSRAGVINQRKESAAFGTYVDRLRIKLASREQLARNLSGGNQQKVLLARWLARESELIILDEPTRGIDIGAKQEIYQLIRDLAAAGKGVLMVSSELPEVLALCDRILVMRGGRIAGEIEDVSQATQEQVLQLAIA